MNAVVATVVDVEGSGYRRPGARMVVDADGENLGAVTAGCLEDSVRDIAQRTLADKTPRVETFDLRDDEASAWGLGLGCNGVIDIFVEPLDESFLPALDELEAKRPVTVLTAIASTDPEVTVGDRSVLIQGEFVSTERDGLPGTVTTTVKDRIENAEPALSINTNVETVRGEVQVFVDQLTPTPDLLIFGSQEDINPVTSLANQAGFRVRVVSARGAHADADRFPAAHEVYSSHPSDLGDFIDVPDHSYAVLMSHNLLDDQLALEALLETDIPYIGIMGPQKRFQELRNATDRTLSEDELDRIATPVGLDLGSDEPTAIGFSIVSEVLAVHNGCSGGRLADLQGPIHERPDIS